MSTKARYNNGILEFYESTTQERVAVFAPVQFIEDFLGKYLDLYNAADNSAGKWIAKDTSAVGTTAEAIVANQPGGVMHLALDAQNEEQEAGLYMNDSLHFNLDKGVVVEFRAAAHVLPTLLAECYFGVANAYVKGTLAAADQGPTVHAMFMLDGSGAVTIHTDDTANDNNAVATGVTVLADAFHVFRIDFSNPADVKFYIDGNRVAGTTTFDMSTGTNVVVQPYMMNYKSGGAGLGDMYFDYVKCWSKR